MFTITYYILHVKPSMKKHIYELINVWVCPIWHWPLTSILTMHLIVLRTRTRQWCCCK